MARRRTIETLELVDVTGTAHRITVDAAADGLHGAATPPCAAQMWCPLRWSLGRLGTAGCARRSPRSDPVHAGERRPVRFR